MIKNLLYIITAALVGGCDLFNKETPKNLKEDDYPLEIIWSSEEYESMYFSIQTQPVLENDLVYLVKRMDLVCMRLEDGKEVWKTSLDINTSIYGSNIIHDDEYLYLHHNWIKKFEKKNREIGLGEKTTGLHSK